MDTLYWIVEYGKVFCGYMFLMFIWPSVVFSKHLQNKDKIYRFSFCAVVQVMIANSVILSLGILHILNQWVVRIIFYGIFFVNILQKVNFRFHKGTFSGIFDSGYRLIMGTYGIKLFLSQTLGKYTRWLKKKFLILGRALSSHILEYILLLIIVLYGMIYFSWGSFQAYGYAAPDMYVHHQWIYGLLRGEIFVDGVYPEAMHCFVYCLHTLFGIRIYSCLHLMGGIHIVIFFISVYSLLREIFQWKYTPIFILTVFLTLDIAANLNFIMIMSRLQSAVPQEFGFYSQFVCVLFLMRYLKSNRKTEYKNKFLGCHWDENLFLFMLALSASIAIHFYTTIMAFFLCISFAIFYVKRIFTKERFLPLVLAVICGVLIAALPMAGALASGKDFQGSIGWALGVIRGENEEQYTKVDENYTLMQAIKRKVLTYKSGYIELYGEARARLFAVLMGVDILLLIICQMKRIISYRVLKRSEEKKSFVGYLQIILASIIFMVAIKASALGLPQLVESIRMYSIEHILLLAVAAIPVDMFFILLSTFCIDNILQILSVFLSMGVVYVINVTGNYHGFLGEYLTRYDSTVMVVNSIVDNFPEEKYTIVSPVDELYQVAQYGYHEELLTFIQEISKEDYKLPTEYVFLFIEKKPIEYAQLHFYQGPSWLGGRKYVERYPSISVHPNTVSKEISKEYAQRDVILYARPSMSYSHIESRIILESKAYLWCQNFSKLHPFEVNVYYEDENLVCYYFKQNPYALYDLAIEDWDKTDGIKW